MNGPASPRRRILAYFLLGIALPSCLLGYLAFRGIQNDQALIERERKNQLTELATTVSASVEDRLAGLESALDAAAPADARATGALADLRRLEPLVAAVFRLDVNGGLELVSAGTGGGPPRGLDAAPARAAGWPAWERARLLELRERRVEAALAAYRELLPRAPDADREADVLAAIGRAESRLGRHREAAEAYARLARDHAGRTTPGGLPYDVVGTLEVAGALLQAGDTAGSVQALVAAYRTALATDAPLTRPQIEFLVGRARDQLAAVLSAGVVAGVAGGVAVGSDPIATSVADRTAAARTSAWRDTLAVLDAEAAATLERAELLEQFRGAGAALLAGGAGARRVLAEAAGREFPVILSGTADASGARPGLLLDAVALQDRLVVPLVAAAAAAGGADWTIRTRSGDILRASDLAGSGPAASRPATSPPADPPLVATALPAPLSSWTVELRRRTPGLTEAMLTSRRGVYFYAFLLLAGILVFGLTLTIRSVSEELRLARMQSDFVSTVSHEFKSPLTAIRQLTEMLQSDRVPSEEHRRRYYDVLLEQSERLSNLIDNVLDFARMDAGGRVLDLDAVAPADLVGEAAAAARRRFGHEGFRIEVRLADALPPVAVDRGAVGQALGNLIDNAARYSDDARDVIIHAYPEDGRVVLAVQDFGIGLRPDDAARVFDRFFRAGDPLTRTVKGTGLGLTLVKQIAEAHGGSVAVESAPGKGSTFLIRLPAATEEQWTAS